MKLVFRVLTLALLLPLCLVLPGCAGEPTAQASSEAASKAASAKDASLSASSAEELPLVNEEGYVIVRNMIDHLDLSFGGDCSACFPADATGYYIEGGPYQVDADTLRRIVNLPCKGDGTVQWIGFNEIGANRDHFTGVIPANKLNDPLYMAVSLPSEAPYYMTWRINAENIAACPADATRALPIAAIYVNKDAPPAADQPITLCLGKINLALKTEEKGWFLASEQNFPSKPNHLYYLPWPLEHTLGSVTLPDERLTAKEDHMEIALTGADFAGDAERGVEGMVFHFWGTFGSFPKGGAQACAASYVAWVKEPAAAGALVGDGGVDWYNAANGIQQAYNTPCYKLTNEPRVIAGHYVGSNTYDTVMDSETVQKLLGLK